MLRNPGKFLSVDSKFSSHPQPSWQLSANCPPPPTGRNSRFLLHRGTGKSGVTAADATKSTRILNSRAFYSVSQLRFYFTSHLKLILWRFPPVFPQNAPILDGFRTFRRLDWLLRAGQCLFWGHCEREIPRPGGVE